MIRAAALCLALLPASAQALSCVRPDVARDFLNAHAAEAIYVVVHGVLTFDEALLPKRDLSNLKPRPDIKIPARLEGTSLGAGGFERRFAHDVTLRLVCFGPWCGGAQSGVEMLAFLERRDGNYVLERGPCGAMSHDGPTRAQLDKVVMCFRGGACAPDEM